MLVVTNVLVLLLVVFFPEDGIKIGEHEIHFLTVNDFSPKEKVQQKTIQDILPAYDLTQSLNDTSILMADVAERDEKEEMTYIEINEDGMLAFRDFFKLMAQAKEKETVLRILHYGDSQIEGDRISSVLRERLQAVYGGAGMGLLPIDEPTHSRMSVTMNQQGPWYRSQLFGTNERKIANGKYGLLGFAHTLIPDSVTDSLIGSISAKANSYFFKRTAQSKKLRLIYDGNFPFSVNLNGKAYQLDSSKGPMVKTWTFDEDQKELELEVKTTDSLSIYAIGLDGKSGIAVDNIPIRGSSGLEFTKISRPHLKSQYAQLNIGMIIYQFGVNVVPHVVDDYGYYKNSMKRQLARLQELNPGVPILVIGTSDMSRKEGSNYVSFPNIEQVRDAQKAAALESGCGFWDLFEAMGGQNSMPIWVFAEPPLAQKDFLHFNKQGANIVGQKLYAAFMKLNSELGI